MCVGVGVSYGNMCVGGWGYLYGNMVCVWGRGVCVRKHSPSPKESWRSSLHLVVLLLRTGSQSIYPSEKEISYMQLICTGSPGSR